MEGDVAMVTQATQEPRKPAIRQTGTGPRALWLGDTLMEVVLDGAATGGQLSIVRSEGVGEGHGAPPHTHSREDEVFVVLDGTVAFTCGETEATLDPGGAVFLPRGIPHAYRLVTPRATMLMLFTPAGIEAMFLEGGEPASATTQPRPAAGPPPPEVIAEMVSLSRRYGCEIVDPGNPT
jgi:quercetin dioxygenase-like cupin family protein